MSHTFDTFSASYAKKDSHAQRISDLIHFCMAYMDTYKTELHNLLEAELDTCRSQGMNDEELVLHAMLSYFYFDRGDMETANRHVTQVQSRFAEARAPWARARLLNFLSYMHAHFGEFEMALTRAFEAVAVFSEDDISQAKGWSLYALAVVHFDLRDFDNAEKYFSSAIDLFEKFGLPIGVARSKTGLASVYIRQGRHDAAENLIRLALPTYEQLGVASGISRSYNDLGIVLREQGKPGAALDQFELALALRRKARHSQAVITTLMEMSETLLVQERFEEALPYLEEARDYCEKVNTKTKLYRIYHLLSQVYRQLNDPWKALGYFEQYEQLRTEILGERSGNKIKELQTRIMTEKAEKEAEIERLRNVELKKAYAIIEQKNREITDSMNYARRIQYALLAHDGLLEENLPGHFVFFQPREIVSGDFYWAVNSQDGFYLAVCDSTGHGVPGAFMSLLNISYLNEAISEKNISRPGAVFDHVRQRLIGNISQEGQKDGMDGILLRINRTAAGHALTYAAANNAPVVVRNGKALELPFDKMPVGMGEQQNAFCTFTFEAQQGDMLYLYTDGYADQFGGDKGKKFKYANLHQLLVDVASLPPLQQKDILYQRLEEWKGDLEQVDDVCIIGIQL